MNNLKVLKKALRRLANQASGGADGTDANAGDAVANARNELQAARRAAKAAGGGGMGGGKGMKAFKGKGAAGMLLAAAAMGSSGVADAGPRGGPVLVPVLPPGGVVEETVIYKQTTRGPLELHVYLPVAPPPPGGRACMVFFHGGGWKRGSPNQFRAFSAVLAQHGVVGMSAEYRLMEGDDRLIPTEAIEDARSVLRYVRKYATRFGCDASRIGAGGGSAGGHLAMMTAIKSPVEDPHDDLSIDPKPAALIVLNGPTNFDEYPSPVPVEERRKFAAFYQVDKSFPPTLMLHGTNDRVIPYAQVAAFRDKAVQLGVNVKLVPFEGRGHGFFNKGKGQPGDWERASNEMLAFLHGLGWL
jgi:acetyl esterase/lipase